MSSLQLLSKITIGDQELQNRLVLAPMTRARCTPTEDPFDIKNTLPNELHVEYYSQRANAGLVITEGTAVSEEGSGWMNAPHLTSKEHADAWKPVVEAVHAKDAKIYLQMWHIGRQAHSSFHPSSGKIFGPSPIPAVGATIRTIKGESSEPEIPHALTVEEIKKTIDDFVNCAKLCKEAGFDGVEIHSANGYLFDSFFQSCSNQRDDAYGGSAENRCRLLVELVEAIVESGAYPANRIGFRLSPNGVYGGMGSEDNYETFIHIAERMSQYGLAYLHVVDGLGFGFHNKCKPITVFDMKKAFKGPVICNVGLTRDIAEGMIRSGAADMAAFGRLYMSNPDLADRFANNWPVEPEAAYENWWYYTGAKGFTDYPTYTPKMEELSVKEDLETKE